MDVFKTASRSTVAYLASFAIHAVKWRGVIPDVPKVDEPIAGPDQVFPWNMICQRELREKCALCNLPSSPSSSRPPTTRLEWISARALNQPMFLTVSPLS